MTSECYKCYLESQEWDGEIDDEFALMKEIARWDHAPDCKWSICEVCAGEGIPSYEEWVGYPITVSHNCPKCGRSENE